MEHHLKATLTTLGFYIYFHILNLIKALQVFCLLTEPWEIVILKQSDKS